MRNMNKKELELFNDYFNDPLIIDMATKKLGPPLKLTYDWVNRKIIAKGSFGSLEFDMDSMIKDLS